MAVVAATTGATPVAADDPAIHRGGEMTNLDDRHRGPGEQPVGSLTGLTPEAAKEFHKIFLVSFILFTLIAIVAHVLVWNWRPWLPGEGGYAELQSAVQMAAALITPTFG
jgi:light-harvesting complex 1 beta chain